MSQALYRRYRPQSWDEVIGQQHVVSTLRNALASGRQAHAYLFAGPRGTGKTTTARLLAKAVNCLDDDLARRPCGNCAHCQAVNDSRFLDLIEIDAASNTSVDDVRDLRDKINFSPNQGRYKVYIVDEVHMLSTAAFNALLKTLEEPPPHAIFVLATTEVHKIPATVLSRCQRHEFRRIPLGEIVACLKNIVDKEGIQVEPEALTLIARQSTGAMRDAISLLDQLASTGQVITLQMALDVLGAAASQAVIELVDALVAGQADAGLDTIHAALDGGSDPRQFARQVVDYLRDLLLIRMGNAGQLDATAEIRSQMARHAQAFSTPELLRLVRLFNFAAAEARAAWQPALPLEMAFIEALEELPVTNAPPQAPPATSARSAPPRSSAEGKTSPQGQAAAPKNVIYQSSPEDAATAPIRDVSAAESASVDTLQAEQLSQKLATAWPQIVALVRQGSTLAYAALNSYTARTLRGDHLILNYASDVLKAKMEKPESMELLLRALKQVLGREITVECTVDTARRDSVPPGVDGDGIVAAALRDLGGELVDIN
jgi:DNA polymerase-3 subunit gamma/tau